MRVVLLVFALALPTFLTWLYFVALAHGVQPNPIQQAVYVLGKVVQFALPVLDGWLWDRRWPKAALFSPRGLGVGVLFGLAVAAGMIALYHLGLKGTPLLEGTADEVRAKVNQLGIAAPAAFFAFAAFISLAHSGLEEYYWRWYGYGRLRDYMPTGWANVVAGLAFMSHHVILLGLYLPGRFWLLAVPFSLCIAVGGMFWAWLYQRTGSLLGPWVSHALVDVAIFVIGWDLIRPN